MVPDRPLPGLPSVGLVVMLSISSISFLNGSGSILNSDLELLTICQSGSVSFGFRGSWTWISSSSSSSSLLPDRSRL